MMKWTEKQQEAISLRDKNILVSAAAGSGKTAVLVERIKGLLLEDQTELSSMLIVTFSNAAASEMREKIVKALNAELAECAKNGAGDQEQESKQRFLRRQLSSVHRCNISTFHAFAMEVIRRYFHLIHVEPSMKICDEGQKLILQAESLEQIFSERFENGDPEFRRFLDMYSSSKNDNDVKDMILRVHGFIMSLPEPFSWLEQKAEALSMSEAEFVQSGAYEQMAGDIRAGLEQVCLSFRETEMLLAENGIESLLPKVKLDIQLVETAQNALDHADHAAGEGAAMVTGAAGFETAGQILRGEQGGFQRFVASKADKEAYGEIKEEVSTLRDRGKDIFKKLGEQYFARPLGEYVAEMAATAEPARELLGLTKAFHEAYREQKELKGLMDFNDIEHFALDILAFPEAAGEYRKKFRYIFVDEYQDSNLVQETLIGRICRENNVFMVGDVKQSIYKFRLAEPELFIGKYQRFRKSESGMDAKIDLNQNFRSKGNIIKAVNDVFSRVMSRESTGMDYDQDAALYQGVDYSGELDYPMTLQLVDDAALPEDDLDEEIKDMKKAELEAYAAARLIAESRGKPIYDAKKGIVRPLCSRDVVILLRGAKGYADLYYKALSDEGIAAFMDNSDGYFDTVEIQVFLNLLAVIDNGKQDLPLLSALRSPVFGFFIDELAEIRLAQRKGAYYEAFGLYEAQGRDEALRCKCAATAESLRRWRRQASYMPLSDFLAMLISENGYGDFIAAIPSGLQRQANLRALVDKAIEYEGSQSRGLFGFIRYVEALKKEKISVGQVRLAGENDDVVRIMTVHKSKGLEFPFVVVGGLGRRFNLRPDTSKVSFHKELGFALRLVDPEQGYYKKTLLQTLIEQKKRSEDMAEEIRTLYVAFTRAMDQLVLMGTVTDAEAMLEKYRGERGGDVRSSRCYLDLIGPVLLSCGTEVVRRDRSEFSAQVRMDTAERDVLRKELEGGFSVDLHRPENVKLAEEIQRRLSYVYPAETGERKSKYSVSELASSAAGLDYAGPEPGREMEEMDPLEQLASGRKTAVMPQTAIPRFAEAEHRMSPAERGTAMHKVMEHIPFTEEAKLEVDIQAFLQSLVERELMTAEEAQSVSCRAIAGFFRSAIGKRACRAQELYRESSFNMKKELSGQEVIVQGTIDCYFREDGEYVLLDYKSNYVSREGAEEMLEALRRRYLPQVALYKEALERIKGVNVTSVYLYLFSIGKELQLE